MKRVLQLEELAQFAASLYALWVLNADWWIYPLLLLGPDISMLGYLGGPVAGAACYNLFHHKGTALAVLIAGWLLNNDVLLMTGIILFGHSAMDRSFGYGLKYTDSFQHTHLGLIGKKNHQHKP